jgi:hypothetical protein
VLRLAPPHTKTAQEGPVDNACIQYLKIYSVSYTSYRQRNAIQSLSGRLTCTSSWNHTSYKMPKHLCLCRDGGNNRLSLQSLAAWWFFDIVVQKWMRYALTPRSFLPLYNYWCSSLL